MRGADRRERVGKDCFATIFIAFSFERNQPFCFGSFNIAKIAQIRLEFFMNEAFLFASSWKPRVRNKYQCLIGNMNILASDIKFSLL